MWKGVGEGTVLLMHELRLRCKTVVRAQSLMNINDALSRLCRGGGSASLYRHGGEERQDTVALLHVNSVRNGVTQCNATEDHVFRVSFLFLRV